MEDKWIKAIILVMVIITGLLFSILSFFNYPGLGFIYFLFQASINVILAFVYVIIKTGKFNYLNLVSAIIIIALSGIFTLIFMVNPFTWAILSLTTIALLFAIYFNVKEHISRRNKHRTVDNKIENYLKIFNYAAIIAIVAFCFLWGIFERPNPWLIPVFLIIFLFVGVNGFKSIWDFHQVPIQASIDNLIYYIVY